MRICAIFLAGLAGFCAANLVWAQPAGPVPTPVIARVAVEANNYFAWDLLRQLEKEQPGGNLFFSPWSISSALAMTLEGARAETAAEMGQVLRLPDELRQQGERPWKLDPFHAGFADMQRRCTGPRDEKKDQETRARLADLRKELQGLTQQFATAKGKEYTELLGKVRLLTGAINKLQENVDLFELRLANAIWAEKSHPFEPAFSDVLTQHYGAGLVRAADFKEQYPIERLKINGWVAEQTNNKIKDIVPELDSRRARLVRMIVVNAIYFKGQWLEPFDKGRTKEEPFFQADGGKTPTPLMHHALTTGYAAFQGDGTYFATPRFLTQGKKVKTYPDLDGFLVAELPYKGKKLSMVVIAPRNPGGLPALEAKLTGANLTAWLAKLEKRFVAVTLPRFKLETKIELSNMLQKMGMKEAFYLDKADFRGISPSAVKEEKLALSNVLHKAFVEVTEEGTEAAAATFGEVVLGSAGIDIPFTPEFRADRPFLFLIREIDTGAILFLGRMATPKT
jgi:serine protease inhibitor